MGFIVVNLSARILFAGGVVQRRFGLFVWVSGEGMKQNSSRSKVEFFRKEFITLARKAGGSYSTVADRSRIARYFLDYLNHSGIKLRQVESIKSRHIEDYIKSRIAQEISHRTLQNEMSALRAILTQAGKSKLAAPDNERLNNVALGISGVNREGKKSALTQEEFCQAFQIIEKQDRGVAATMRLAYAFGLRTKRSVSRLLSPLLI